MKNIILIHAHKNLVLLNELIEMLDSENHCIYVNLDKKANILPEDIHKNARLIQKRINIEWGRFSLVQATLNSLIEIEHNEREYGHVVFISGQDFPLVSNEVIDRALIQGKEYIRIWKIGSNDWNVADRFESFYFGEKEIQKQCAKLATQLFFSMMKRKRKVPLGYSPYGGSAWWMLSQPCIQYILQFIRRNRGYLNFFRSVKCGDEIFFQTLLMNSKFKESIIHSNFHYMDWCIGQNGPASSPKVLNMDDYEKIVGSGNLFCRKVDLPESRQLLDALKVRIFQP